MVTSIDDDLLAGIDDEDWLDDEEPITELSLAFSHPHGMVPMIHYKTPTGKGGEELHYLQYMDMTGHEGPTLHNVFIKVGKGPPGASPDGQVQRIDLTQSQMDWLETVFNRAQEGIVNRLLGSKFLESRSPDFSWMSAVEGDD